MIQNRFVSVRNNPELFLAILENKKLILSSIVCAADLINVEKTNTNIRCKNG